MEGGGGLADRNLVIGSEGKIGLLGGGGWYWIEINVIIGGVVKQKPTCQK